MATRIPWTAIKALSFDIFGTLIDWESGIYDAICASAIAPYVPSSRSQVLEAMEGHERAVQKASPELLQRDVVAKGFRRYAEELKIVEEGKLSQGEVDEAAKEYGNKIGDYKAFPDTIKAIQTLGKHYKLVPVTNVDNENFSRTLSGPLKGCHFDACYTAEDIGSYKPELANFHYLLDHLTSDFGVEKDELCHVAQSLYHDHKPAKQMGIQSVWVDRNGIMGQVKKESDEDFGYKLRVGTLGELAEIVTEAFSKA